MFIQLTIEDCQYLLTLIADMDADTAYTAAQRRYTVPKLERISEDPRSARFTYQDVDYLLELIEDDDLEECEQQRALTFAQLYAIQELQTRRFRESKDIEEQRQERKARRRPVESLQAHFEQVTVK